MPPNDAMDMDDRGGPAQPLLELDGLVKPLPFKGGLLGRTPPVVGAVARVSVECWQGRRGF